jgi:hypothetical protein
MEAVTAALLTPQRPSGVDAEPPRITPARGPPLWDGCDVPMGDVVEVEPDWGEAAQVAPDFEVDQRVSW